MLHGSKTNENFEKSPRFFSVLLEQKKLYYSNKFMRISVICAGLRKNYYHGYPQKHLKIQIPSDYTKKKFSQIQIIQYSLANYSIHESFE